MENLLLQPLTLFIGEVHGAREAGLELVVHLRREILTLGCFERTTEVAEFPVRLLEGPPKSIEGLSRF